MRKRILAIAAVTGLAAITWTGATTAHAQQGVIAPPISNWSYQRHSSTATEGYLRGQASVIQAVGQAVYLDSIAAVNYQEAARRHIENHNLYVKNYLENRELNHQFREKYAAVPPTKEQWARITEASLPDRLTPEQYDPSTGRLVWPHILRGEEYAAFRERIDELIATRTPDNSGNGSPSQRELSALVDGMKLLLKNNIDNVSASQYGAAKWFLLSLDYEAELSMQTPAAVTPVSADNTAGNLSPAAEAKPAAAVDVTAPESSDTTAPPAPTTATAGQ